MGKALLASDCYAVMEHATYGLTSTAIGRERLINLAGEFLVNSHDWLWLQRPMATLNHRAKITLTGASWTEATRKLTKTGAFATYEYLEGDTFQATAGTNTTLGFYEVESRVDDDNIILKTTLESASSASAIAGEMDLFGVALPDSFKHIEGYAASDGVVRSFQWVGPQSMLDLRTNQIDVGGFNYYAYIGYADPATDGEPVQILSIYPTPAANDVDAMKIIWSRSWRPIANDNDAVDVPRWMQGCFLSLLRAYALGYDQEKVMSLGDRLRDFMTHPEYITAKKRDNESQPTLGKMLGGAVKSARRGYTPYLSSVVSDPS